MDNLIAWFSSLKLSTNEVVLRQHFRKEFSVFDKNASFFVNFAWLMPGKDTLFVVDWMSLAPKSADLQSETDKLVNRKDDGQSDQRFNVTRKVGLQSETDALVTQKDDLQSESAELVTRKDDLQFETDKLVIWKDGLQSEKEEVSHKVYDPETTDGA